MTLREQAHAMLDQLLNDHPQTSVVLVAVDGKTLEAISIPPALSTARGVIDSLYDRIHPE